MILGVCSPSFELRASVRPETVIVLTGELDLAAVEPLERTLTAIDLTCVRRVTLDLSRLEFIDAIGLRAVLRVHELCRAHSVALAVTPGPRCVQRVFQLTNTAGLLPFSPHDR